jgi:hypothetical protein
MGPIIAIALIGSIVAYFVLKSGETIRFETSSTPRQITMGAVGLVAGKRRWQTLSQGDGSANFVYHKGPNKLIALIGLLFFVLPGLFYIIIAGKKEALAVNTEDSTAGITVVQVTSNGWRGKVAGRAVRNQFALAAGSLGQTTQGLRTGSVAALEPSPAIASPAIAGALESTSNEPAWAEPEKATPGV